MSENLELARSIYANWERGDFSRTSEWAHPEMEWGDVDGPAPGRVTGLAAMAAGWREFLRDWDDFRAVAEEYQELDEQRVIVFHHFSGRGKTSGLPVEETQSKGACLFQVDGHKVTKLLLYWVRDRAIVDLGLTPDTGGSCRPRLRRSLPGTTRSPGHKVSESLDIALVEAVDCPRDDLDILPRHRLLHQPDGFEGFGSRPVKLDTAHLSLRERPDGDGPSLYLDAASSAPSTDTHNDDQVVREGVSYLEDVEALFRDLLGAALHHGTPFR